MMKKISEKKGRASRLSALPSSGSTPMVKGTVAQRGMAKKGPMVR